MTDRTSTRGGSDATFPLRLLLAALAILGTAVSLFEALFRASSFPPNSWPTRADILSGDRALILAAVIAAGAPLAALLLAWLVHNRGAVARWAVVFAIGLIAAGLILHSRHDYLQQCLPERQPGGTYCAEYRDAPAYQTGAHAGRERS